MTMGLSCNNDNEGRGDVIIPVIIPPSDKKMQLRQ